MPTTRYYFDGTAPAVSPAYTGVWTDQEDAGRLSLIATPPTIATSSAAGDKASTVPSASVLVRQSVGPANLPAATLSGTARAVVRVFSTFGTSSNAYVRFVVKVVSGDGTTVRGVLADFTALTKTPNSTNTASRIAGPVPLTPVTSQAGDRLVVELGADMASGLSDTLSFSTTPGSSTGDLPFADGNTSATLLSWVELALDDPPSSPLDLTQTAATPNSVTVAWTAPTGTPPTSYEVRVDGGSPIDVGDVTTHTVTGLTPATGYLIEVRALNGVGASAWASVTATTSAGYRPRPGIASQAILAAVGLNPDPDGPDAPAQQWWDADIDDAWTYNAARSEGLVSYTIGYASRTPLDKPQTLAVTVAVVVPIGEAIAIGDRFRLRLGAALAAALGLAEDDAIRATAIVTDVQADPTAVWSLPGHGPAILYTVTATGWLARYGATGLDGTGWPTETPGARLARILIPLGLAGDLDAGGPNLLPPAAPGTAHQAIAPVTDSTRGRLIEQRHGATDYDDPETRRGTLPALTLDAGEILGDAFSWRQSVGDVVNEAKVTHGVGDTVTVRDPASADPRSGVGPYPAQVSTVLAAEADAYDLANDLVGRRAWPYFQLPAVTVDLARSGLDTARLAVAFALASGQRVALTSMPPGSPWDTLPRGCFVEGYVETATAYAWRLALVVSDPALSGVSLRYIDVPDTVTYNDVLPDLDYLYVSRIEDPADLT